MPEMRWDFQCLELLDEVYVEVDSDWALRQRGSQRVEVWCSGANTCWTVTVSNSTRYHSAVNGAARGLFIRNVLQAMELKAVVQVGRDSSAAAGITPRVGAVRVRHLEVKDLWMQEKIRSHELKISREKSENNRADFLREFLDPDRHHKLIKTRQCWGVVCPCYSSGSQQTGRQMWLKGSRRC